MIRIKEGGAPIERPEAEKAKVVQMPERLIFPAPPGLVQRLDDEWHRRRLKSRSETIRVLLEEALK